MIIITITENTLACTTYLGNSTVKTVITITIHEVTICHVRSQVTLSILLSISNVNTMSFALIATMLNTIQVFFVN